MHFVYFLKSTSRKYHYIGVTQNVEKRLREHNNGYSKSTKPYRPFVIIHTEIFQNSKNAYKREFYLKSPKGYTEKIAILRQVSKTTTRR